MMQGVLDALSDALGAEGAAAIDVQGDASGRLMHRAGRAADQVVPAAAGLLAVATGWSSTTDRRGGRYSQQCGARASAATPVSRCGARPGEAAASPIRMVSEHEAIQHEMAQQARTDLLTGLLNRPRFWTR